MYESTLLNKGVLTVYSNIDELKEQILFELGYPVLRVELLPEQISYCINKQMKVYATYLPFRKHTVVTLPEEVSTFQIHDDENRNILGIGLILTPTMISNNIVFPPTLVNRSMYHAGLIDDLKIRIITYQTYELIIEDFLRRRYEFRFNQTNNTIEQKPSIKGTVYVEYYTDYKTINEIPRSGQEWVFKYQLQLCKQMIGRLRSKYSGLTTVIGNIETDGQTLLQEQQSTLDQLEQEIKLSSELLRDIEIIG